MENISQKSYNIRRLQFKWETFQSFIHYSDSQSPSLLYYLLEIHTEQNFVDYTNISLYLRGQAGM